MHINDIVREFLDPAIAEIPLRRVELVIRLSMWLRFSDRPDLQETASLAGFLSYVSATHKLGKLSDLPDAEASLLHRNIRLDYIANFLIGEEIPWPDFDLSSDYHDGQGDYWYIADIVRFLIWYTPPGNDKRQQASLQKAYFFIKTMGFRRSAGWSRRWLLEKWGHNKNASALLYVTYYHSDFNFLLDPREQEFRRKVDEIASHPSAVSEFLLKSKWVAERIEERLHHRARSTVAFPAWPVDTASSPLPEITLGQEVYRCLKG
jgi:hypothetical protein